MSEPKPIDAAPTLRFSIDALPAGMRLGAVQDWLAGMMRTEVAFLDPDAPFSYHAHIRSLPNILWGSAHSSAVATTRTKQYLEDGCDDLILVMPQVRMVFQLPGEHDMAIGPGDAALVSQAREMRVIHGDEGGSWAVRVNHREIAQKLPGLGAAPVLAIHRETPMLSLLRGYGRSLDAEKLARPTEQQMVARHLTDMMSIAVGASKDFRVHAEETSLATVRISRLRADIAAFLGHADLRLDWFAARQGVSPRHLQRLLAREGTSFAQMLRRARVERAWAMLQDQRYRTFTIASIALECGFSEASSLNRAFREEYGLRPSDLR